MIGLELLSLPLHQNKKNRTEWFLQYWSLIDMTRQPYICVAHHLSALVGHTMPFRPLTNCNWIFQLKLLDWQISYTFATMRLNGQLLFTSVPTITCVQHIHVPVCIILKKSKICIWGTFSKKYVDLPFLNFPKTNAVSFMVGQR